MKTRHAAFTLIEIMIVVAIIGLLATIAIPSINQAIRKSQKQACIINRKNIDGAKATWALDKSTAARSSSDGRGTVRRRLLH